MELLHAGADPNIVMVVRIRQIPLRTWEFLARRATLRRRTTQKNTRGRSPTQDAAVAWQTSEGEWVWPTPLLSAVCKGPEDVRLVELLVLKGADVNHVCTRVRAPKCNCVPVVHPLQPTQPASSISITSSSRGRSTRLRSPDVVWDPLSTDLRAAIRAIVRALLSESP